MKRDLSLPGPANSPTPPLKPENTINLDLMANIVAEVITDIRQGACAETITQTVQIMDLGNGKRVALKVTLTTDEESFL